MNKYNFDLTIDRRKTYSYKWDCKENEISLSIADTDFMVLPEIKEAILKRSDDERYGYTYVPNSYFEAYKKWFGNRYHASFEVSDCIYTTGIVASLDSVIKRITNPNDGVMILTPNYNVFFNIIKNNNRKLVDCPFRYENFRYEIDWALFESKLKEAKVFIFCNPHNPIGMRFSKEDILKVVDLCKKHDVYLLSDEIHADFDYNDERYVSTLSCVDYDKLMVFFSPGKTFNVAGLHSSIIVIKDKKLREKIQKGVYEDDIGEPNYFSVAPVIAAYTYGDHYVKEMNDYLVKNRELVKSYLLDNCPHLHLIDNEMTYLLWIDISHYQKPSNTFVDELRKEVGLILCPGNVYGDERFVRMNIATSCEILKDALERLHKYILKLEKR